MVAVVGRRAHVPAEDLNLAALVGRELADGGFTVVTGGRGGVMEAVAIGAAELGGQVVAITPFDEDAIGPASVVIRTGLTPQMRNIVTASCCVAMVALPGSFGTWQEMIHALDRRVPVLQIGYHPEVLPGAEEVTLRKLCSTLQTRISTA
jgi:uncharacterized protein (TIGR00725 family)